MATAPQMPRPPSQIFRASIGCRPDPKYFSPSVMTWYSRPPMMPKMIAQNATSQMSSSRPPRARHRRRVSATHTKMPATMHSA